MIASNRNSAPLCSHCGAALEPNDPTCFHCGNRRDGSSLTKGEVVGGRYELLGILGRGGMGAVYEAHDRSLDERVALKILSGDASGSAEADRRFRAEIKLARRIRHANVCAIHEYGELRDLQYIVMEFVDGQDLKKYLRLKGRLPVEEVLDLVHQIGEGLQAIHDAGVIHRDLKLANVMRDTSGRLRLMDFGIAKGMTDTTATATGQIVGTPEYMSPEQAKSERVDLRSDVYALGIAMFELLTGRVPFKADTPLATLMMHVHQTPPLDDPGVPPHLAPILRRALAKDPDDRYASARDMLKALTHRPAPAPRTLTPPAPAPPVPPPLARLARAPSPVTLAAPVAPSATPRHSSLVIALALACAALLGLGVLAFVAQRLFFRPADTAPLSAVQTAAWPETNAPTPKDRPAPSPARSETAAIVETRKPQSDRSEAVTPRGQTTPASTALKGGAVDSKVAPTVQAHAASTPSQSPEATHQRVPSAPSLSTPTSSAPSPVATATSAPEVSAPSGPGLLRLVVRPWADIVIDGRPAGQTPLPPLSLTAGRHTVVLTNPAYAPIERQVEMRAGETLTLRIDWATEGRAKQ